MMEINKINSGARQQTQPSGGDAVEAGLRKRMEEVRKQMRELAQDKDMEPKMKQELRTSLQERLVELQQQITQHQMEQRQQKLNLQTEQKPQEKAERKDTIDLSGASQEQMEVVYKASQGLQRDIRNLEGQIRIDHDPGSAAVKQEKIADLTSRTRRATELLNDRLEDAATTDSPSTNPLALKDAETDKTNKAEEDKKNQEQGELEASAQLPG